MKRYLIGWLLIGASCTTMVQFPVTEPPEITLNPGTQSIVFVSRFDTTLVTFKKEKVARVYKQSNRALIEGLEEGFNEITSISFNPSDTMITGQWYTFEDPRFHHGMAKSLLSKYQPDYLLTLDAYRLDRIQDVDVTENEDGSKSRQAYYDLEITALLSLYDGDGNVVDKIKLEDRQYIDDRSVISGLLAVGPNIGNFEEVANPLAYDIGFSFSSLFVEHETMMMRSFHSGKDFKQAVSLVQRGQWIEAEKLLLPLAEHSDKKLARQAAVNLSVVYEAQGKYDKSNYWKDIAESY